MPVPIGISIGDFIALGKLLKDVHDCLGANARASKDFQVLVQRFKELRDALETVYATILQDQDVVDTDDALVNGLNFHWNQSRDIFLKIC